MVTAKKCLGVAQLAPAESINFKYNRLLKSFYFVGRTHWKTTSCRPNNMEEEMAIAAAAGSPPGYYDFVGSDLSVGKCYYMLGSDLS